MGPRACWHLGSGTGGGGNTGPETYWHRWGAVWVPGPAGIQSMGPLGVSLGTFTRDSGNCIGSEFPRALSLRTINFRR